MLQQSDLAELTADFPEGFRIATLEEVLPPEWLRPAPEDADGMKSLADGLLVETTLALADRTVDARLGYAAYHYLSDVIERGVASLMAEGWPVYQALQGVAGILNVARPLSDDDEMPPEVARLIETCREEAARHRTGQPTRLDA